MALPACGPGASQGNAGGRGAAGEKVAAPVTGGRKKESEESRGWGDAEPLLGRRTRAGDRALRGRDRTSLFG